MDCAQPHEKARIAAGFFLLTNGGVAGDGGPTRHRQS
jgi:hypothetical protein